MNEWNFNMEEAPRDGTPVLLWMVHENAQWSADPVRDGWETPVVAYWTDFNTGGWVWHGLCGAPVAWQLAPLRPLPSPPKET